MSLLVVVRKAWFTKSPWDSYTKFFNSEAELLDWWLALPDESYTKSLARVYIYNVDNTRRDDILAPWAPPRDDTMNESH